MICAFVTQVRKSFLHGEEKETARPLQGTG